MSLIKDKRYYFEDGNHIFRVGDHLFKIHHFLLTESSFFEGMFALPQKSMANQDEMDHAEESSEGSSDNNPIVCQDSVTSFQALCWGLYLRPLEVRKQGDLNNADLRKLISLAPIAHKYDFTHLEEWAIAVLREHWRVSFPQEPESTIPWTSDMIAQIMTFSAKTNTIDQEFKTAIESEWLTSFIGDILDPSNIQRALDTADGFSSHRACGLAYYHLLRRFDMFRLPPVLDSVSSPHSKLGPAAYQDPSNSAGMMAGVSYDQRLKLMRGLWCLVSLQGANSLSRVQFECTCPPRKGQGSKLQRDAFNRRVWNSSCRSTWEAIAITLGNRTLDFGAMLEEALNHIEHSLTGAAIKRQCKQRLAAELQRMLSSFKENLVDYFTLP